MTTSVATFKNQKITVHLSAKTNLFSLKLLKTKLEEMELNFEFRKKLKRIQSIELINEMAIFYYIDGTKLYLQVS